MPEEIDAVSEHWLQIINQILEGLNSSTVDLKKPHLKPAFKSNYLFIIFVYAIIVVVGIVGNVGVIIDIVHRKLYREPTYGFLINLALSDILKCVVVLPITLAVLLIQNWVFGQFLCFFLPMLQDIPLHVSTLTFLLIAGERYHYMQDPTKPRTTAFVFATSTWFFAVCIVLPYLLYVTYLDLGPHRDDFDGLGLCVLNLTDHIQEYMRGLFLITYAAPMTTIAYLHVRISRELQRHEGPLAVLMYEAPTRHSSSAATIYLHERIHNSATVDRGSFPRSRRRYDVYEAELNLNVCREKRNQRYHVTMVTVFGVLLCPLMVLRLVKLAVPETYDNANHFDYTYALFVLLCFLPTCTTPCLYASWQMTRSAKDRLRGYFRFSNRMLRQSNGDVHSETANQTSDTENGSDGTYIHKASISSSCQVEQMYMST